MGDDVGFGEYTIAFAEAISERTSALSDWPDDWRERWMRPTPLSSRIEFLVARGATAPEIAHVKDAWEAWRRFYPFDTTEE